MPTDVPELYTLREAAEHLKCSEATVRNLIQRGDLKGTRVGKLWRVTDRDLADYLGEAA